MNPTRQSAGAAAPRQRTDPEGLTDEALVTRARVGDEDAIRALVQRHNQRLFRVARSVVGNDAEAEDVVQATYVSAFTHLQDFRADARFLTWLTRIALNEALGRLRRRRQTANLEVVDAERDSPQVIQFHAPPPDPEAEMQRLEARQTIEHAVDALPLELRTIFVLRDIEGMSIEETAAYLGIPEATVSTRLHRARRALRAAIHRQLSGAFAALFPFLGARCQSMGERVLQDLRRPPVSRR